MSIIKRFASEDYVTEQITTEINNKMADVPTKVSELENDAGYITGYTETDPTVPAWAKASTKPSYTASEVGALPNTTVIPTVPTKVSAFTNDAGYLTQHQSLDAYAKTADLGDLATKDSLTASEVGADASGTAAAAVEAHNTATDAHADIRAEIAEVNAKIVSEVMTMTKEQYDSITKSQFAALYAQGVRIIAVDMCDDNSDSGDSGTTTVINFVPISIDEDGNIYNGVGYKEGYRLNSSGGETAAEYSAVTGYIPVTAGDIIRIDNTVENVDIYGEVVEWYMQDSNYICAYDSNFNYICGCTPQNGGLAYGGQQLWTSMELVDGISVVQLADISNIAYIRVNINGLSENGAVYGAAMFITVNQAI